MMESSVEVALLLRRLAEALEESKAVTVILAGESIVIPADADMRVEYESGGANQGLTLRATWKRGLATPELVHRHTEQVVDTRGRLYDALIYGEPRADGTWEGWIEFRPVDGTSAALRTGRETTQPDRAALTYWATGLEPLYFAGAFERAQ